MWCILVILALRRQARNISGASRPASLRSVRHPLSKTKWWTVPSEQYPKVVFRPPHAQAHTYIHEHAHTDTHTYTTQIRWVRLPPAVFRQSSTKLSCFPPHTVCPSYEDHPMSTGQGCWEECPSLPLFHLCVRPLHTAGELRL